ncbi:MAG: FHA domain-containing protein [Chloroflexota bacterium]|nr:FHA domain-containing protein [Chloroflexota bacterium]
MNALPKIERPICPKCGNANRVGALICDNCGSSLTNRPSGVTTKSLGSTSILSDADNSPAQAQMAEAMVGAGSESFQAGMLLRLEIPNAEDVVLIEPGEETVIGRRDPSTGIAPDIDLTAYAGYKLGVSRKHAILRVRNDRLELLDLGSSNGTSINGERITAHEPHALRDGDQIGLGKMTMRALFQSRMLNESELDS